MTRRVDLTDPDNPERTPADFARGVGPEGRSDAQLAAFPRTELGGRAHLTEPKLPVSLRLSPAVIRHFRNMGPGWQARINATLEAAITRR